MTGKIRIGVLGAAKIVPSALLAPARQRDDMTVTHVAARDRRREAEFAALHGLRPAGGYEALIARDDIDLIYVAIPPSGHCEWSIRALEAGKAVLCEKPFAMNAAEAERMAAASGRTGRPLIEAFHYRYHPTLIRAEGLVRAGALGSLIGAHASFCTVIAREAGEFRWDAALGGGALMDLGCYPIHALRTLIGSEPQVLSASGDYVDGVEAEATARLRFGGAVDATVRCGMRNARREWDLEIVGEHGRLAISNFIVPHVGGVLTLETAKARLREEADGVSTYAAQLAHVAEVMRSGQAALTGGGDAVANMRVIDAIRAAAGAGSQVHPATPGMTLGDPA